jgi:hypothetical protein
MSVGGLLLLVTGCSGVPESSAPEKIRAVGGSAAVAVPTPTPQPGADPRAIVTGFLEANVSGLPDHNAAKGYLTQEARNSWSDNSVTIVDSLPVQVPPTGSDNVVTVTANEIGTVDQNGIYQRKPQDFQTKYTVKRVNGEWRIDKLSPGLVVQLSDFIDSYRLHPLYYFDLAQKQLVPDPRYTALSDQNLATWLLDELTQPPRPELASAVFSFPDTINVKNASVTASQPQLDVVELPGSSRLPDDSRRRLAAQLAYTFGDTLISITDGRREVTIPGLPGPFSRADFPGAANALSDRPAFYLNEAGLVANGQNGKVLDGPLGHQSYRLTSIALGGTPGSDLRAAGTVGPKAASALYIGTERAGLRRVDLRPGQMSRPAWAPGLAELWLGYGATLRRVLPSGASSQVQVAAGESPTGTILAVRFSPDGTRIALVVGAPGRAAQCVVGTVERGGDTVRVDNLVPITPADLAVTDVGWNDGTTLYLTGANGSGYGVWSVQSDGSGLNKRSENNLPAIPTAVAAAPGVLPWVASGGGVFVQRSNNWNSPFEPLDATVRGGSPVYLE